MRLTLLILGLLLSRLFLALTTSGVGVGDALYRGMIAMELLHGTSLPLAEYRVTLYSGGAEIVESFILVPFFWLFGPSYFSLRIGAGLTWSLLIFIVLYLFLKRHFSCGQAKWAAIFFILAPPAVIHSFLMQFHLKAALFFLGFLWLFYEWHFGQSHKNWPLFFQGVLLGFGTYVWLQILIAVSAFFLFAAVWNRKSLWHPSILLFFLGFLIGYAPGIYQNITYGLQDLMIQEKPFYEHFSVPDIKNFLLLFRRYIPGGLRFETFLGIPGALLAWSYCLAAALAFFLLLKNAAPRLKPLLLFVVLLILVYGLSDFDLKLFRYLVPLYVFFCLLLGLYAGQEAGPGARLKQSFKIGIVLIGIMGWLPLVGRVPVAQGFTKRGFTYAYLLDALAEGRTAYGIPIRKENLKSLLEASRRFIQPRFLPLFERGIGAGIFGDAQRGDMEKDIQLIEASVSKRRRLIFLHQLGYFLACGKEERPYEIDSLLLKIKALSEETQTGLIEGIGDCLANAEPPAWVRALPKGAQESFFRGVGEGLSSLIGEEMKPGIRQILNFPEEYRPFLFEGLGRGVYWWVGGHEKFLDALTQKVPASYQSYFAKSFQ